MTGQRKVQDTDEGALVLGVDLQSLDVDSLLGPLAGRGSRSLGFRQRPPRVGVEGLRADEVISAQKKALDQPAPAQTLKAKAANCLAHGPALVGGKCGERMYFIVTTVTSDGQVMKEGGASVTCTVTGRSLMSKTQPEPRPFVEDRQDGTYHIQFVCATPGVYEITACVDGVALPMCPVAVTVAPGPPSATTTQVRGDGSQRCTLGGSAEFTIQAMDEFGNLCGEGGARFGVRASAHVRLHEVSDNEDGTYTVSYSIPDWAQGPVKLEVLLDGHPIRGSPLVPRLIGFVPEKADPKAKSKALQGRVQKGAGGTFTDQLPSLRWLREHPPLPVPEIPAPDVTALAATGGLNGLSKVGDRSGDPPPEASVSRLAWSAADEWRRLAEVRSELERCRDQLAEHQAVLLHVGDAIHTEVDRLQEWERNVKMREDELGDVEKQLEGMRSEIQKQYLTQKRLLETMSAKDEAPASPRQLAAASTTPRSSGRTGLSALSPGREVGDRGGFKDGVDSSPAPALPWETRSQGKASAAGQRQPLQASAEEELISLQRGIEQKKRQLRVLEEEAGNVARPHSAAASGTPRTPRAVKGEASPQERLHPMLEGRLLSGLAPPPAPPPLDAAPPPVFGDDAGRARIRNPAHPGQCGGMPDRGFPTRSTVEAAVGSDPLLPEPPVFSSDTAGLGVGLLRAPPPPPAPPPSIALGGSHSSGPSASPKGADRARGSMPADFKKEVASPVGAAGMATTEELGQAMKQLFHAFASRAAGSVAKPGGGRAGRVALGLQDYLRMAHASQLRLSQGELEAVFAETAERFGSPTDSGEPALAFELFVELLVETARRQFTDLKDTESAAALFEVHLLPLARRLRRLERDPP